MAKMGRNSIPMEVLKARREYEVNLYMAGFAPKTIVKQVNAMAPTKNWGTITHQTFSVDLSAYYKENQVLDANDHAFLETLRQAHADRMNLNIERAAINVAQPTEDKHEEVYNPKTKAMEKTLVKSGKKWKAFEYQAAIESLHKMFMDMAEFQNWNLGRKNMDVGTQESGMGAIYDRGSIALAKASPTEVQALLELTNEAMEEMRKNEEKSIIVSPPKSNAKKQSNNT